jgi:hypothetical protein
MYGGFVWARRALNRPFRRFPARAVQRVKREISAARRRPVSLHCAVLAFTPRSELSISNAMWLKSAFEYDGLTTDQWFFPFTLNSPALSGPSGAFKSP